MKSEKIYTSKFITADERESTHQLSSKNSESFISEKEDVSAQTSDNLNDRFDPTGWSSAYDASEIVSFTLECFECILVTYLRNESKLIIGINDNNREKLNNYTVYGKSLIAKEKTVLLTNEQNNQLLYMIGCPHDEACDSNYKMNSNFKIVLKYSDDKTVVVTNEKLQSDTGSDIEWCGNNYLYDIEAFFDSNLKNDLLDFRYSIEYLCPHCNTCFKKWYVGSILDSEDHIICNNCNFDLVDKSVISVKKKKKNKKSDTNDNLSPAEIAEKLNKLRFKRTIYIIFVIVSVYFSVLFLFMGLPQVFLVGLPFFLLFTCLLIGVTEKIQKIGKTDGVGDKNR